MASFCLLFLMIVSACALQIMYRSQRFACKYSANFVGLPWAANNISVL